MKDTVWTQMRAEAEAMIAAEPQLSAFVTTSLLEHETLEQAVAHRVAAHLAHDEFSMDLICNLYAKAIKQQPELSQIFRADLNAVLERDPACYRLVEPLLFFKGFTALQSQRLS